MIGLSIADNLKGLIRIWIFSDVVTGVFNDIKIMLTLICLLLPTVALSVKQAYLI